MERILVPPLCQPAAGSIVLVRQHRLGYEKNNTSSSGRGTHWSIYQKWVSESFEWVNVLIYCPQDTTPFLVLLLLVLVFVVAVLCGNQEKLFPQDQVPRRRGWGYIKRIGFSVLLLWNSHSNLLPLFIVCFCTHTSDHPCDMKTATAAEDAAASRQGHILHGSSPRSPCKTTSLAE